MNSFGKELILDLHECNKDKFNRVDIENYFEVLCYEKIDMERCELYWWDYLGYPEEYEKAPLHLRGTSAVQFIMTSSIVLHTLDELGKVYVDIFSCKDFDPVIAREFTEQTFEGHTVNNNGKGLFIDRL